jgi:hypothetical protein
MKVNFQETIKQKTDTELEIISKDYVFTRKRTARCIRRMEKTLKLTP